MSQEAYVLPSTEERDKVPRTQELSCGEEGPSPEPLSLIGFQYKGMA